MGYMKHYLILEAHFFYNEPAPFTRLVFNTHRYPHKNYTYTHTHTYTHTRTHTNTHTHTTTQNSGQTEADQNT